MGALLEAAGQEHGVRLRALQQRAAEAAAADVRFKELQHLEEVRSGPTWLLSGCLCISPSCPVDDALFRAAPLQEAQHLSLTPCCSGAASVCSPRALWIMHSTGLHPLHVCMLACMDSCLFPP